MSLRPRFAPAVLVAGALLLAHEAVHPAPARADAIDDAVKSFEDYLKTNPDSQGIRNQIAELGLKKDPRVAKALTPLLKSPKYDDDVKIAVAQCIGEQGDPAVVGMLKTMADAKDIEKDKPKVLAAILEGIGDADAKRNYEFLMKIGKKQIDYNADVASAAFRAASLHVSVETVEDMLKELDKANTVFTNDSAQKQAGRNGTKPVLMEILKKLTGENISDVKAWKDWWNGVKKTGWKPPAPGESKTEDLSKLESYSDAAYGYEVKRPNKAWIFRKGTSDNGPKISLEALDEGQRAAWCELYIYDTKGILQKRPEQLAQTWRENNEPKFRDFKEQVWDRKTTCGGAGGLEMILVGQHKELDAVAMHNVFVEKSGMMYYWICVWKSGKPASMKEDIEEVLRSFRIKK
ncbi:MAG TPA: HEAT repeat domain-containing protein [Planctomycetota bacterium]|nr:HEAT repeat domain-containing protein [Planctomycetota bacterium]